MFPESWAAKNGKQEQSSLLGLNSDPELRPAILRGRQEMSCHCRTWGQIQGAALGACLAPDFECTRMHSWD